MTLMQSSTLSIANIYDQIHISLIKLCVHTIEKYVKPIPCNTLLNHKLPNYLWKIYIVIYTK